MSKKFRFYNRLYLGESIPLKKLDKLKKQLGKNPFLANVYLIVTTNSQDGQLEILDSKQLIQPFYTDMTFTVIGIGSDYSEALILVEKIVQECLSERGDCNLREYLLC